MSDAISEVCVAPLQIAHDLLAVYIEQQLVMIETMSVSWIVGAPEAISIEQSGPRLGQVAVPHLIGLFRDSYAMQFPSAGLVKQTEFHRFRMLGK